MTKASPRSVIAITSHVAGSPVGGAVTTAVMLARGIDVALVPTVLMGRHPGKGAPGGGPICADQISSVLSGLKADGWVERADAIFVGYVSTPEQVNAIADFLNEARAVNPALTIMLDPILGDGAGEPTDSQLYIRRDTAFAIRERLVPEADFLTPNLFELAWLSARTLADADEIANAARSLGDQVVVTSTPADAGEIGVMAVDRLSAMAISTPRLDGARNGAGDLFAAELLAGFLADETLSNAAADAAARVGGVFAASQNEEGALRIDQATLAQPIRRPAQRRVGAIRPAWAMGVDGCPSGWCAVMVDMNGVEPPCHKRFDSFSDLLGENAQIIAVDMPIGFQDSPGEAGMRACEREARAILGSRRSSIFPSPLRPALASVDYREASALNRQSGGPGLSKQSFNLFAKLTEIDALMDPAKEGFVFETHPETSFAVISGAPAHHSKKTPDGRNERLALLERYGLPRSLFEPHPYKRKDAAPDDLVDAGLCALTALRIAAGTVRSLPETPPRDGRGLRMAIFA